MKIPPVPPRTARLLSELPEQRFQEVLGQGPLVAGKYLHWDEIRHRKAPPNLSLDEWWLGIMIARMSAREHMPLHQEGGTAFSLVYVPPVRQGLHEIDQSFGMAAGPPSRVAGLVQSHGPRYLLANSLIEEAIRSSQLEGAATTRAEAKEMLRQKRKPRNRGERMILNNFRAMERVEELANQALTKDTFFELHAILAEDTLDDPSKAGVFRTAQDKVVVELLNSVETAHVPPPADELPRRLDTLLEFANGQTPTDWLHPVLRAIILHFMVGYDHPFVDGNGRVARALFYWAMVRYGYPLSKYLSISRVLREAPAKYSRAYLYTETDDGDLTYFVLHQIDVIRRSIRALEEYVEKKDQDLRQVEETLRGSSELNHRQLRLLGHAVRHPGHQYTVPSHQNSHRVVPNTARADLDELAEMGLLLKSKEGRRNVYIAPGNIGKRIESLWPATAERD